MTVVVQDTFTDTDGTSLDVHTPDTQFSGGWTEVTGNWGITGNQASIGAARDNANATIQTGEADCTITVEALSAVTSSGGTRDTGIAARHSDTNNYWRIGINDFDEIFRITERNGGTNTTRASTSVTINNATYYTVQVVLNGSTITATLDGANEISYGSATLNQTATVHGIVMRGTTDRVDDFLVEVAAGGTQYNQSADGALTPAGALVKQAGKVLAGTLTSAGALATAATFVKNLTGSITPTGALSRSTSTFMSGTLTSAGAVNKLTSKSMAGALTPAGGLAAAIIFTKAIEGTLTMAGDLTQAVTYAVDLSGTLTSAGTLVRSTSKLVAGTLMAAGTLVRQKNDEVAALFGLLRRGTGKTGGS